MAEAWEDQGVSKRESPLMGELSALHAQLDRLEHQATMLRTRLEPVIAPRPETRDDHVLSEAILESQANVEIRRAQKRVVGVVEQITLTLDELQV